MDENLISFEDFSKLDMNIGEIINVEEIEKSNKLLKLEVDLGEKVKRRTICAGLKPYYSKEDLKNKKIIVVTNLVPRKIFGIESEGMLLAAVNKDKSKVILISPEKEIENGSKIQ